MLNGWSDCSHYNCSSVSAVLIASNKIWSGEGTKNDAKRQRQRWGQDSFLSPTVYLREGSRLSRLPSVWLPALASLAHGDFFLRKKILAGRRDFAYSHSTLAWRWHNWGTSFPAAETFSMQPHVTWTPLRMKMSTIQRKNGAGHSDQQNLQGRAGPTVIRWVPIVIRCTYNDYPARLQRVWHVRLLYHRTISLPRPFAYGPPGVTCWSRLTLASSLASSRQ
jgi:hypothetical protein